MGSTIPHTEGPEAPSEQKPRLHTFRALQYRNFRLLWISLIVSSVGTWMQIGEPARSSHSARSPRHLHH